MSKKISNNQSVTKVDVNDPEHIILNWDATDGEIMSAAQIFLKTGHNPHFGTTNAPKGTEVACQKNIIKKWQQMVTTLKGFQAGDKLAADKQKAEREALTFLIKVRIGGQEVKWQYCVLDHHLRTIDEIGAAARLTDICQGYIAYDIDRESWRIFNGKRWCWLGKNPTQLNQVLKLLPTIVNAEIKAKETTESNVTAGNTWPGFVKSLTTARVMREVAKLAQDEQSLGESNVRYNAYNHLINCQNGEVNLLTGELEPHNPEHRFTKICPVIYIPTASSKDWLKFLNTTFQNKQKLIDYLQIAAGDSALSGINTDRHFYIINGPGRDGKSVFLYAIGRPLGINSNDGSGFADTADIKTFMTSTFGRTGSGPSPDLANLDGLRLVVPTEPDRKSEFDEGQLKSLTGKSDVLKVRNLNSSPFSLYCQFALWIACNDIPRSSGSEAVMDRMVIIPFSHKIKPGSLEDDPNIEDKLSTTEAQQAIFAWLVQGSVKANQLRQQRAQQIKEAKKKGNLTKTIYQDPLLPYPDEVSQARDIYQYGANSAAEFLFDRLVSRSTIVNIWLASALRSGNRLIAKNGVDKFHDGEWLKARKIFNEPHLVVDSQAYISKHDLYSMYKDWAHNTEGLSHAMTMKNFNDTAKKILCEGRLHSGRVWLGIGAAPYFDGSQHYHEGVYRQALQRLAKALDNGNVTADYALSMVEPNYDVQLSDKQQAKVDNFINKNASAYCNQYKSDTSSIELPHASVPDFKSMFAK